VVPESAGDAALLLDHEIEMRMVLVDRGFERSRLGFAVLFRDGERAGAIVLPELQNDLVSARPSPGVLVIIVNEPSFSSPPLADCSGAVGGKMMSRSRIHLLESELDGADVDVIVRRTPIAIEAALIEFKIVKHGDGIIAGIYCIAVRERHMRSSWTAIGTQRR
jgi:hypothetical protein